MKTFNEYLSEETDSYTRNLGYYKDACNMVKNSQISMIKIRDAVKEKISADGSVTTFTDLTKNPSKLIITKFTSMDIPVYEFSIQTENIVVNVKCTTWLLYYGWYHDSDGKEGGKGGGGVRVKFKISSPLVKKTESYDVEYQFDNNLKFEKTISMSDVFRYFDANYKSMKLTVLRKSGESIPASQSNGESNYGYLQKVYKVRLNARTAIIELNNQITELREQCSEYAKEFDAAYEILKDNDAYFAKEFSDVKNLSKNGLNAEENIVKKLIDNNKSKKDGTIFFKFYENSKIGRGGKIGKFNEARFDKAVGVDEFESKMRSIKQEYDSIIDERDALFKDGITDEDNYMEYTYKAVAKSTQGMFIRLLLNYSSSRLAYLYDSSISEIAKLESRIKTWETKVDNVENSLEQSYKGICPALQTLRKDLKEKIIESEKEARKTVFDDYAKCGSSREKLCNYYIEKKIPSYYISYLDLTDEEIAKNAELTSKFLVIELDIRVAEHTGGEIVETEKIFISNNGSLNGNVKSANNKWVGVSTILAGGYNIQRRHYRVIVGNPKNFL